MFWKEIGNWFKNTWNGINTLTQNVFGAGSSTSATIIKTEINYIPEPFPITAKAGTTTTQIISKYGNSSKPLSVYAKRDTTHPIKSSSAGIKINISKFTLDISLGLDNVSVSGSMTNNNTTNCIGIKADLSELKIGVEVSSLIQWDNTIERSYTNVSISGWTLAAAYIFATTGKPMPSPSYAYGK